MSQKPKFIEERRAAPAKKKSFNAESTLLIGCIGLATLGMLEPTIISMASNGGSPPDTMIASTQAPIVASVPAADYTPVGVIDRNAAAKPGDPQAGKINAALGRR